MGWFSFRSRAARDRAHTQELEAHLQLQVEEYLEQGLTREEAVRRARLRFGNPRVKREEIDDLRGFAIIDVLSRDVRHTLRLLRRSPAFTLTAVATLALVIGANTAVFSLADTLLLRPLPYPHPESLGVVVTDTRSSRGEGTQAYQDGTSWEAIRSEGTMVDAALIAGGGRHVNLVANGTAASVAQSRVSAHFFRVLAVAPVLGREFTEEEDHPGGPAVAVLSFDLARRLSREQAAIVGTSILLRGEPYDVVGVMPKGFQNPGDAADVWTPARPSTGGEGSGANYQVIARLKSGFSWSQANGQLAGIGTASFKVRGLRPGTTRWWSMIPLHQAAVENVSVPIEMLGGAVGLVLVMACVNLAALLLARGGGRRQEIATRMALGGGRAAVIRQLLVENLVLGAIGGVLGLLVGTFALDGLKALAGDTFHEWQTVTLDGRALAATGGLSLLTSLCFGLAPAIQAGRVSLLSALSNAGSRNLAGGSRAWGRRALVSAEVALGVVLLVVTGLLIRTFVNLRSVNPGFDAANVTTASVSLDDARYRTAARVNELFDESLRKLTQTPGILSAAVSLELPYRRLLNNGFTFADAPASAEESVADFTYVTPAYFSTMRVPVRAGRVFTERDIRDAPAVVVVNETFVRSWSKGTNPIGRRIRSDAEAYTIVGVVGDVQVLNTGLMFPGRSTGPLTTAPAVFLAAAQVSDADFRVMHTWFSPVWSVRAASSAKVDQTIQRAIGDVDPLLPVSPAQSMSAVEAEATAVQRLLMTLVGVLACAAVVLSAIGVWGLIAQTLTERRREFGVRLALGATPWQTIRAVGASSLGLAAVGAAVGLALAWLAVRVVESVLWGVTPHDGLTFAGVTVLMLVMASVASVLPALKILKLDPVQTLRE